MKGRIRINVETTGELDIDVDVVEVSFLDILVIFDALAHSLDLDEDEKKMVGVMLINGGLHTLPGVTAEKIEVPPEMVHAIRKMKEKKNETDEI